MYGHDELCGSVPGGALVSTVRGECNVRQHRYRAGYRSEFEKVAPTAEETVFVVPVVRIRHCSHLRWPQSFESPAVTALMRLRHPHLLPLSKRRLGASVPSWLDTERRSVP